MNFVTTGVDEAGKPTYGLSTTYDGKPVGSPLTLVTERNASGVVTGVRLPYEILAAAEAA